MSDQGARPRAYVLVGVLAALDLVASVLTLWAARSLQSVETIVIASVWGLTGLLGASVVGWIAVRAPPRKDVWALSIGLLGLTAGGNFLVATAVFSEQAMLVAVFSFAAGAGFLFGNFGFFRFFALFPRPIGSHHVQLSHANRLSELSGVKKEKLLRSLEAVTRISKGIQGDGLWRVAGSSVLLLWVVAIAVAWAAPSLRDTVFYWVAVLPLSLSISTGAPFALALTGVAFGGSVGEDRRRLIWIHWGLTAALVHGSYSWFTVTQFRDLESAPVRYPARSQYNHAKSSYRVRILAEYELGAKPNSARSLRPR